MLIRGRYVSREEVESALANQGDTFDYLGKILVQNGTLQQEVLQQALFTQQQRHITARGDAVRSLVALYKALGGGWEGRDGLPYLDDETRQLMQERTDWGDMLEADYPDPAGQPEQD